MDENLNNRVSAPPNAPRHAGSSGMSHVTRMGPNPAPTQILSLVSLQRLDFDHKEKLADNKPGSSDSSTGAGFTNLSEDEKAPKGLKVWAT